MPRTARIAGLMAAVILVGCHTSARPEVAIAAAANLAAVFDQVGLEFERATGIHPVFSFASTAQLARQIENSAPFDLFAAADAEHVGQLESKGLIEPGTRAVYAIGVLALWVPPHSRAAIASVEDLAAPGVRIVAVAKPELAPYGRATVETLRGLGIWERVQPKIVYAENISMAKQFGASNNADAVFTARSLVLKEAGQVLVVDERLHQPISQELGIVRGAGHRDAARTFAAFLLKGNGRTILAAYGYRLPR